MRLKRRNDFQAVYRDGAVWKGVCFSLHVLRREERARIGIVVPRRWGTAVERNRIKRRLREAFRRTAPRLPNADIIIQPTTTCRERTVDEIADMLRVATTEAAQQEVTE
jgi:ribonuclease P protein component